MIPTRVAPEKMYADPTMCLCPVCDKMIIKSHMGLHSHLQGHVNHKLITKQQMLEYRKQILGGYKRRVA